MKNLYACMAKANKNVIEKINFIIQNRAEAVWLILIFNTFDLTIHHIYSLLEQRML
jgi:hypothetical protein